MDHGAAAYLLSLGLTLTLLGVTGLTAHGGLAALVLLGLTGAMALCSLEKRVALVSGGAAAVLGMLWLLLPGRALVGEVINALIWHVSGLTTALPLVGAPFTVMVCVLCMAAAWFVTQRSAGPYPALLLIIMAGLLLWLLDMPHALWGLLPAVLCCLTLLLRASDEAMPVIRVLPVAVAITCMGYAGVWAGGVTCQPLKDLADDIRQRIYDTLFYTAPRDVFTLASEGYYPQGQGQLGGPADPHTDQVMVVHTPRKTYLRGAIKDVYTGRAWQDTVGSRRYLWSAGGYRELRASTFDEELPSSGKGSELLQTSRVTVRMLNGSASSLFVPQRLRTLTAEGDLLPYFNAASEVFATRNLALGDVWHADAPLFTSASSDLRTLVPRAEDPADPNWQHVRDAYLQLPEHLDARIYAIASEAAGDADTAYDKALNIQRYLASNYAYTLDMPEQDPTMDFVTTFLLLHKKGYCTYFATAMTVLCRMEGLPARYVEGYVANPDATGQAILTGEDGHAWTEVYFPGFGWVTFDATPTSVDYTTLPPQDEDDGSNDSEEEPTPSPSPSPTPTAEPTPAPTDVPTDAPDEAPGESPTEEPSPTPSPSPEMDEQSREQDHAKDRKPSSPWPWLWLLLIAAVAARVTLVQPAVQAKLAKSAFRGWLVWTQAVHDALYAANFRREKTETPAAFMARVDASGKWPASLAPLGQMENLMFYGHVEPEPHELREAAETFRMVHKGLTWWQRGLFQLRRIALPRKLHDMTRG